VRTTDLQCDLIIKMLRGKHYLRHRSSHTGRPGFMLYSGTQESVRWYSEKTVKVLHEVLRSDKQKRFTLNLKLVRQLDGRTYIKKQYKKTRSTKVKFSNQ
jgi:hypothetical protein